MERTYGSGTEFSDVDASGRPSDMIAYLDGVTRFVAEGKRASFAGLELQAGSSVVDVGCGAGDDVRMLCEIVGPSGFVAGVDSSAAMVDEARLAEHTADGWPGGITSQRSSMPVSKGSPLRRLHTRFRIRLRLRPC